MRPIIAYPGVPGSFSEGAAREAFPEGECWGYATFPEAAEAARIGAADYALLPIETPLRGRFCRPMRCWRVYPCILWARRCGGCGISW